MVRSTIELEAGVDIGSERLYILGVRTIATTACRRAFAMTSVKIDAETLSRLRAASGAVQLCDDEGHIIGYFRPACGNQRYPEPPVLPPEELQRRLAVGKGRKISEIIADLESRS